MLISNCGGGIATVAFVDDDEEEEDEEEEDEEDEEEDEEALGEGKFSAIADSTSNIANLMTSHAEP